MIEFTLLGINHKTAAVDVRECIALTGEDALAALQQLAAAPAIQEVMLLSTCNRVEVMTVSKDPSAAADAVRQYLLSTTTVSNDQLSQALYVHAGDDAIRHLFRVAGSLDSMMVGEPQILGQVKEAYRLASEHRTSGVLLNRLMHRAFFVAKRIRSETGIGDSAVSISYAAVELAKKIFEDLEGRQVLLIGAGEMAELAVEHLKRQHIGRIFVANRTFERAVALAETFGGTAVRMDEIPGVIEGHADIVIGSTGSPDFVVDQKMVQTAMRARRNRPIFFIDIAVPRDIDPTIQKLSNVYVYDIDDLNGIVDENLEERRSEAVKGERIVDEAVIRFRQWYQSLDAVPTIKALRAKCETIADQEIQRTLPGLDLTPDQTAAIDRMVRSISNKFLHDPTQILRSEGCRGDRSVLVDQARKLFGLDD